MRCLTLAYTLRNRGAKCRFVCRKHPGNLLELIREQGFETIALPFEATDSRLSPAVDAQSLEHAAWLGTDWATDAEQTKVGVGETVTDWLIVDHYALDARWESAMRSLCKRLMVIDDVADRNHDCDLLLDQNLFADMAVRYIEKVPTHCGQMLGPDYALLQPQYAELHPRIPPREGSIGRMLVYFGGADTNNLTGMAVAAYLALEREDISLDVVINASNPYAESLQRKIEHLSNITLHVGLPSLAPLMAQADLAIGAGGVTSWERCCMGLPTLVITLAVNQTPIASELDRLGLIRWLGSAAEVSESGLLSALKDVCATRLTPDWSIRCRQTVDGKGAQRVASMLMLNAQTKLKARLARVDDEELLLRWANDSLVRENSFVSDQIDRSTHHNWFCKRLRDLNGCRFFIVETEDNVPIGQVRFDLIDNRWEIDYSLDAVARGNGVGVALLESAIQGLRASVSGALLFGRVKSTNQASRKVFERLDFQSANAEGGAISIAICSDAISWINPFLPKLLLTWLEDGHSVAWGHSASELHEGDVCFYLSYSRIVDAATRARFKNNLVVHESDLPRGRGWSPMTWLILEGEKRIPVTLLEAVDQLDAGPIYLREWIDLRGNELNAEWRQLQAEATLRICKGFVSEYPSVLSKAQDQEGEASFYPRRRPKDSELDPNKTIAEQFNVFRVVENKSYPAFFELWGRRFVFQVESG